MNFARAGVINQIEVIMHIEVDARDGDMHLGMGPFLR